MYSVSAQGIVGRVINARYYYYYYGPCLKVRVRVLYIRTYYAHPKKGLLQEAYFLAGRFFEIVGDYKLAELLTVCPNSYTDLPYCCC